jgi:dolichol-phosphate mannosyltransferase
MAGPAQPTLSLIVPTFNEVENIAAFLDSVYAVLQPLLGDSFEVIVVDDDSPDGSWRVAQELSGSLPGLRAVRRRNERGLASAVMRGWREAKGEILGTMNADFQHPPEALAPMLRLATVADLVIGSRYCQGGGVDAWSYHRRLFSKAARWLGAALIPQVFGRTTDPLSGFYLVRRAAIEGLEFRPSGFKTLIEILAGGRIARIAEYGYAMQPRRAGRSKAGARQCWWYLRRLVRLRGALRNAA